MRTRPTRVPGRLLPTLGVAVLAALAVLVGPAALPAAAHADLASSDPADGADLDRAPREVTLTFSEDLLPETVAIVASAEGGDKIDVGSPTVDANVASVGWPADAPAGAYTVSYRVVSQDGHPVTGKLTFRYAAPRTEPSPSASSPSPAATSSSAEPTATPTAASSASEAPTAAVSPAASTEPAGSGLPPWVIVVAVVGVLVVVAGVAWAVRRGGSAGGSTGGSAGGSTG